MHTGLLIEALVRLLFLEVIRFFFVVAFLFIFRLFGAELLGF